MPDLQETAPSKESGRRLSAFQRYLLEERRLADRYQQVIDAWMAECTAHNPAMDADTRQALHHYFVTYIAHGADPQLMDRNDLSHRNSDKLATLADTIPDKLTPASRERFARLGAARSPAARWDTLFPEGDVLVVPLAADARSLREQIDDVIAAHNTQADKQYNAALAQAAKDRGITQGALLEIMRGDPQKMSPEDRKLLQIGKAADQIRLRICENDTEQLEKYDRRTNTWNPGSKLSSFLQQGGHKALLEQYNDLGTDKESRRAAMRAPIHNAQQTPVPYGENGTRADEYSPASLRVVISRNAQQLGEASSGQSWYSCMSERNGVHFPYLDADVRLGTLIAYLVTENDPEARRPLARILLKPHENPGTGEIILVPGKPYGGRDDYRLGRRETLSPKARALFEETVMEWARASTHRGREGIFQLKTGLYADGELTHQTLKSCWTSSDIEQGLRGFRGGLMLEFLTEHQTAQRGAEAMPAGEEKASRQKDLYARYARKMAQYEDPAHMAKLYLRQLKKTSLGAVPDPEQVMRAAKSADLSPETTLKSLMDSFSDPALVMHYCVFEARRGHPCDTSLVRRIAASKPELVFDPVCRDVLFGKPWSEELAAASARQVPVAALEHAAHYADQPWADSVLEIAARQATPAAALHLVTKYIHKPFAQDVLLAVARADPDLTLQYAARTDPRAAYATAEGAAEGWEKTPVLAEDDVDYMADDPGKIRLPAPITEIAARNASPSAALQHLHSFHLEPYAGEVLAAAAAKDPDLFLRNAKFYIGLPCGEKVLQTATENASPTALLSHLRYLETRPYAQAALMAAVRKEPALYLERASDPSAPHKPDGTVLEAAARSASPETLLTYADMLIGQPWAREVYISAAQQDPTGFLKYPDTQCLGNLTEPVFRAATQAAMAEGLGISDMLVHAASRHAQEDWAREVIITLSQEKRPSLAILQNADRLQGLPWADAILTQITQQEPLVVLANTDRLRGEKATPQLVAKAAQADPRGLLRHLPEFINEPWSEHILRDTAQTHPDIVLALAPHYEDRPYAAALIAAAAAQAAETAPHSVLKFAGPVEPEVREQAVNALLRRNDPLSREILFRHAAGFAGETYGEQAIRAAAEQSPAMALAHSETFRHLPWAEAVLSQAAHSARHRPDEILSAAPELQGKSFAGNNWRGAPNTVTGEALVKWAARQDPRSAIEHAAGLLLRPDAQEILTTALQRAPEALLRRKVPGHANWPAVPWADTALAAAFRKNLRNDPAAVWAALQDTTLSRRDWAGPLQDEAYRAVALQDPDKAKALARRSAPGAIAPPADPAPAAGTPKNDAFRLRAEADFHNPALGRAYGIAGLLNRVTDTREQGAAPLDKVAIGLDTVGLSTGAVGNAAGLLGNMAGAVSQAQKGYEAGGMQEAAYQGGKSAGSAVVSAEILAPGSTLAQVRQLKDIPGALRNAVPALKNGAAAVKEAATITQAVAAAGKARESLTLANARNLAGAGANFAGRMGLVNSAVTVGSDTLDYATGRRELNMDNAGTTAVDTVVNLDPVKAVTSVAGLTRLVGVDTGIQNISIESAVSHAMGYKGETISGIRRETMAIYEAEQKRWQPGMLDTAHRLADTDDPHKPRMTDYKHLAALRLQFAKYIPGGKIDGKDVATQFHEIDMTRPEHAMKYKMGLNRMMIEQEKIMIDHSSYIPRWLRSGRSAEKYNEAESQVNMLKAAEKEWQDFENRSREYHKNREARTAAVKALMNAGDDQITRERDEILGRAFANQYAGPEQKERDAARLSEMLGKDRGLAQAMLTQAGQQGAVQKAKQAADQATARHAAHQQATALIRDPEPGKRQETAQAPPIAGNGQPHAPTSGHRP